MIRIGLSSPSHLIEYGGLDTIASKGEQEDTREKIDIKLLNAEIEQIVAREQVSYRTICPIRQFLIRKQL